MKYLLLISLLLLFFFSACEAFEPEPPITVFFQDEMVHAVIFSPMMNYYHIEKCKCCGKEGDYYILLNKNRKEVRILQDFVFKTYQEADSFGRKNKQL